MEPQTKQRRPVAATGTQRMGRTVLFCLLLSVMTSGCQSTGPLQLGNRKFLSFDKLKFDEVPAPAKQQSVDARLAAIGSDQPWAESVVLTSAKQPTVRAQSPDSNQFGYSSSSSNQLQERDGSVVSGVASEIGTTGVGGGVVSAEGNLEDGANEGARTAWQYPEFATPDRGGVYPGNGLPSPNVGSPNELNPLVQPFERGGNAPLPFPMNYADIDIYVAEQQTGRINFGGAYNSDNGIVGQFTIDEKNFDITRWPRSFRDIANGTAWRGGGQQFRLELVPGANLERYLVSLTEPYLFNTNYSLSVSAYLFDRNYFDWDEQRLGGRVGLGRRLTPDLSISLALRMESITVDNLRSNLSPTLNQAAGTNNLFLASAGLVRDTRDSQVNATEGTYLSMTASQGFGDYSFTRGDLDFRTYRLLYERPDGSGRHTLSFGSKLGFSGSDTPIFENYFAGGFSTLRGFDFRGAAPLENGVRVGGQFQWLNTVEYMFPITADDAIKGVVFCDYGTVEESVELQAENFRVAPGFGLRVAMPGQGGGAPLAFDFAFPVAMADGDDEKVFSFYLGVLR